ncbi:hypothetical protein [Hydrogenimonas sp. SS33]|uniref:phenylacetate--CoA ligase family protein n=1 Tax=Hydrogenimonas leucolamina TaxID=2954236 RepID=UPI00336C2846
MSLSELLYELSPVFMQNFFCSLEGAKIYRRRFGENFFAVFDEIKDRDRLPREEMEKLKTARMRTQLVAAYENSEYYKNLFDRHAFDPYKFEDFETLQSLPLLKKEALQENLLAFLNRHVSPASYITLHTSGTTGAGLVFPESKRCENEKWAVWWRYRTNLGISLDTWCANFGGKVIVPVKQSKPPYHRIIKPFRQVSFSMYHLGPDTVGEYVKVINRKRLHWIHGFPSTLSYLASLMQEKNLVFDHPIRWVTIGAESLLPHQKKIIREVFGTDPRQHYGLSEPVANISECEHGSLHVDEDFAHVEFLPLENESGRYQIVGSSFANDALLFLRYCTNDIVTLPDKPEQCPCGRIGRVVRDIEGRKYDYIVQKDGSKIMILGHIFRDMVNIREVQVKQEKSGFVTFFVVPSERYTEEDEALLRHEIEMRFRIDYAIEYVDKIEKTERGKLRLVISELA